MSTKNRKSILVVDDEKSIRDTLRLILKENFDVETLGSGQEFLSKINWIETDLVFLDLDLGDSNGLDILKELKEQQYTTPVVMLSGSNTIKNAVDSIKLGAIDYIHKPFDVDELSELIYSIFHKSKEKKQATHKQSSIISNSPAMDEVKEKIALVARHSTTVLITGESGTGKELVAKTIHSNSQQAKAPFVALNCAAMPENLIEAELFGYEKGAFTGADQQKKGLIEAANGGTLFLDEIGEIGAALQAKLLRFLQEREYYSVGGRVAKKVSLRVVAATNKELEEEVAAGKFREDLFYRLNVVAINLPNLASREGDLEILVGHFLEKFKEIYKTNKKEISDEVWQAFSKYSWPGNIRELENTIESFYALEKSERVEIDSLPARIRNAKKSDISSAKGANGSELAIDISREGFDLTKASEDFEKSMIEQALSATNNVQTKAAAMLGITRRMLKYKIDKFDIQI